MRLNLIVQIFLKELREALRDRRSLLMTFGLPVLIYPLMTLGMAGLTTSTQRRFEQQTGRVAVVGASGAPELVRRLKAPESGLKLTETKAPRADLAEDRADVALILPPRYEASALAGKEGKVHILLDRRRAASGYAQRKIEDHLREYERRVIGRRLQAKGVPVSVVKPLALAVDDVSPKDNRLGMMLARVLPMILLFTALLGCLFPAIQATTSERETGTLESLLVTPVRKTELLLGKGILVLLAGLLTGAINLVSMTLVLWRITLPAAGADAPKIDIGMLALGFLAAVPTIFLFAAMSMVVGLMARNFKEANAFVTPLMFLPLAPALVFMTEPKTTLALLCTPVVNTGVILRDLIQQESSPAAFAWVCLSSLLYGGLMLSLAARLFSNEQLVNPSWEPLTFKGVGSKGGRRRLPDLDEAFTLAAVSLLLGFYLQPMFLRTGLLGGIVAIETLTIAAPAVLFAWLLRYRWREVFSWRAPSARQLLGAALIGVGVLPWVYTLAAGQEAVWPRDPETSRALGEVFLPVLERHPVVAPVLIGLMAGVCEELLFRGPVQAALLRRCSLFFTLLIGGFLFAAVHLDPQGMLFRTLLGMLLGWTVLKSGSIFPAMLMHMVLDSVHFGLLGWVIRTGGREALAQPTLPANWPLWLAGGGLLAALGLWLFLQKRGSSIAEPVSES